VVGFCNFLWTMNNGDRGVQRDLPLSEVLGDSSGPGGFGIVLSHHHHMIISSYHIVDLKRQNLLKVGTNKPKLKVKMQSISDDDVRKRLLEQTRFELFI